MIDKSFIMQCPACSLPAEAVLKEDYHRFILYRCPRCGSNVVCYEDHVRVISDRMVRKLIIRNKLKFCGSVRFSRDQGSPIPIIHEGTISEDDVLNLRILLETEEDSARIIESL